MGFIKNGIFTGFVSLWVLSSFYTLYKSRHTLHEYGLFSDGGFAYVLPYMNFRQRKFHTNHKNMVFDQHVHMFLTGAFANVDAYLEYGEDF